MKVFPLCPGPMHNWPVVEAVAYAREVLAALHPDWTIALATNAEDSDEEEIRLALKRCKLDSWMDRIYCFRKIGKRKPSPFFFHYILNDLNLSTEVVIFVGDDFETDILGANHVGMRAIWVNSNSLQKRTSPLHRTIHNLNELPSVLTDW